MIGKAQRAYQRPWTEGRGRRGAGPLNRHRSSATACGIEAAVKVAKQMAEVMSHGIVAAVAGGGMGMTAGNLGQAILWKPVVLFFRQNRAVEARPVLAQIRFMPSWRSVLDAELCRCRRGEVVTFSAAAGVPPQPPHHRMRSLDNPQPVPNVSQGGGGRAHG